MLSKNYYKSVACLNEMGATWILQKKYTSILLPGFVFEQIKGAVNAGKVGIKLDGMENDIKYRLKQLRDNLQLEFELEDISDRQWYRYVDTFIEKIKDIKGSNT